MWLISGTVPDDDFYLDAKSVWENSNVENGELVLPDGRRLPVARGITALAATTINACQALAAPLPRLLLTGDAGTGHGSQIAYSWLAENLAKISKSSAGLQGVTFHYFYPDVDGHNKVYMAVEDIRPKPVLVADAGFMYVAKMSGYATSYDLFTPDLGELAFLADEKAPHPFYTRGFLLAEDEDLPKLLKRAISHDNCPANMIVKGGIDYILCNGELMAKIASPAEPSMECIGGTGDIVTGLATAFLIAGNPICQAALLAAQTARFLARHCKPNPATQAAELIAEIPAVLKNDLQLIDRAVEELRNSVPSAEPI